MKEVMEETEQFHEIFLVASLILQRQGATGE